MIRSFLTLLIVASLGVVAAHAKTVKVPSDESPLASIDIPDEWHPEEIADGVSGSSDASDIVVVTAADKKKETDADLADSFTMLKEHSVEPDQSSKKVNKIEINGLDAQEMLFQGKETLGSHVTPVSITIIVVPIKDKVIVLTHFVSTEDESKSKEAVAKMIKSLKPAS